MWALSVLVCMTSPHQHLFTGVKGRAFREAEVVVRLYYYLLATVIVNETLCFATD